MNVKVVSITQPLVPGVNTAEELIVHNARVSNPDNQLNMLTADKLLAFLIRKKHWSPYEQANFGVQVTTSRAIAAQILRHWSLSVQEFSQRYAAATGSEPYTLRKAGTTDRQGSTDNLESQFKMYYEGRIGMINEESFQLYDEMIEHGVAKESARFHLPLSTSTTMYLSGTVRDWIHYLAQRTDQHAQLEHRLIAYQIEDIFNFHFPNVNKAIRYCQFEPDRVKDLLKWMNEEKGYGFSADIVVDEYIEDRLYEQDVVKNVEKKKYLQNQTEWTQPNQKEQQ